MILIAFVLLDCYKARNNTGEIQHCMCEPNSKSYEEILCACPIVKFRDRFIFFLVLCAAIAVHIVHNINA